MPTLQKQYLYKISRGGIFLGSLTDADGAVTSEFTYNQLLNTPGADLQVVLNLNAFVAQDQVTTLATESGDDLITESGDLITTERTNDIIGNSNSKSLIRKYNDVEVYEFSTAYPNGKLVFKGYISKWSASFGTKNDASFTVVSNGVELDNYLIQGASTQDQSQTSQNTSYVVSDVDSSKYFAWTRLGQSFTVGAGTNLSAIALSMEGTAIATDVTINVYSTLSDFINQTNPIGTVTKSITGVGSTPKEDIFTFTNPIPVSVGAMYWFIVSVGTNQSIPVNVKNGGSSYAGGSNYYAEYTSTYSVPFTESPTVDTLFRTYYTAGATESPFLSQDPAAILRTIISTYASQGGQINYASGSTDLVGSNTSYTFKINTVLDGIKKLLELAPSNYYWYVDPATQIIYFKQASTTPDHRLIQGRHIVDLDIDASVEDLKNVAYLNGGDTGSGDNLFMKKIDEASLADNKVGLARLSDSRVKLSPTGDLLLQNFLDRNSDEVYDSTIVVSDNVYDINTFALGQMVGFGGFGNFVDQLMLQIVGKTPHPNFVELKLGHLPRRTTQSIEQIIQDIIDLQVIANPDIPS